MGIVAYFKRLDAITSYAETFEVLTDAALDPSISHHAFLKLGTKARQKRSGLRAEDERAAARGRKCLTEAGRCSVGG